MSVKKAALHRRVNVVRGIRVSVMSAVMGCPPQYAALRRGLRQERQSKLADAAGAEGAMRKIAMIAGANREDAQHVQRQGEGLRAPGHAGPDGGKTSDVNRQETEAGGIRDVVTLFACPRAWCRPLKPDRSSRRSQIGR
jgi:hypothetical protein